MCRSSAVVLRTGQGITTSTSAYCSGDSGREIGPELRPQVSWRWLIDLRGEEPKIDWPRLVVVLVVAEALAAVVVWVLSEYLGWAGMILMVLPIAALLIALDVKMRRGDRDDR